MAVGVLEFLGDEFDDVGLNGFKCRFCEGVHLEEPLVAETGLGYGVGVAFGVAHFVLVFLHFLYQSGCFEILGNLTAHVKSIHAYIHSGFLADGGIGVENVDAGEVVFLSEHVVVHVVSRCHFQTSCAEFDVNV